MDTRCTNGVKSPRITITSSASRWYSENWPSTKISEGHSCRARRPDMPPYTPKAFASYEAARTTPPPTAIALPSKVGFTTCSTDA